MVIPHICSLFCVLNFCHFKVGRLCLLGQRSSNLVDEWLHPNVECLCSGVLFSR